MMIQYKVKHGKQIITKLHSILGDVHPFLLEPQARSFKSQMVPFVAKDFPECTNQRIIRNRVFWIRREGGNGKQYVYYVYEWQRRGESAKMAYLLCMDQAMGHARWEKLP